MDKSDAATMFQKADFNISLEHSKSAVSGNLSKVAITGIDAATGRTGVAIFDNQGIDKPIIVSPKFLEEHTMFGASIALSYDGRILMVGDPVKINDETTKCPGSYGGVYTFGYDAAVHTYRQSQRIRPPDGYVYDGKADVAVTGDFGTLIKAERVMMKDVLIIYSVDGCMHEYRHVKLKDGEYSHRWQFVKSVYPWE